MNGRGAAVGEEGGRRPLDEAAGFGVAGQERRDVVAQGVVGAAGRSQEGIALTGRHLQCGQEQLFLASPDRRIDAFHSVQPAQYTAGLARGSKSRVPVSSPFPRKGWSTTVTKGAPCAQGAGR